MIAAVESPWDWVFAGVLVFVLFGSLAFGRYLGRRDEKALTPEDIIVHPMKLVDDAQVQIVDEYFKTTEAVARMYHGIAIAKGEEAAEQWLKDRQSLHKTLGDG